MYVYIVEERGRQGDNGDANCDGNGSIKSVDNAEHDAYHNAEPESFAEPDSESES